jgi:hypothetical protein
MSRRHGPGEAPDPWSYVHAAARSLLTPWSTAPYAERLAGWPVVLLGLGCALAAAGLSTLLANWTYLAAKGYVQGWSEMDTGQDDLPPDSSLQVAFGLTVTVAIWTLLLLLAVAVCREVARWIYGDDQEGLRAAISQAWLSTVWFVPWAAAMLLIQIVRGGHLGRPARWPLGETFEIRPRLAVLLFFFPWVWAVGLHVPRRRAMGRLILVLLCVGASWLAWAGVFRLLPWVSIEAYTG